MDAGNTTTWPYDSIRTWFGEPLSPELIERISSMPTDQAVTLAEAFIEAGKCVMLGPVDYGHLRPLCLIRPLNIIGPHPLRGLTSTEVASQILLYAHEAVVPEPMSVFAWRSDSEHLDLDELPKLFAASAQRLLDHEPLARQGALHWLPTPGLWEVGHWAVDRWFRQLLEWQIDGPEPIVAMLDEAMNAEEVSFAGVAHYGSMHIEYIRQEMQILATSPEALQPLFLRESDEQLASWLLENEQGIEHTKVDGRGSKLRRLAALTVPKMAPSPKMVALFACQFRSIWPMASDSSGCTGPSAERGWSRTAESRPRRCSR
jgi:hypothetical protein